MTEETTGTATQTAEEATPSKKAAKKGAAKNKSVAKSAKKAAKGKAKVADKAPKAKKSGGARMSSEATIKVLKTEHSFRGKRVDMFKRVAKNGQTVKAAIDALEKGGYGRYSGFLHICQDAGLIKIQD